MSLERALSSRRSVRAFASRKLRDDEVMKLLWAAQGITAEGMFRTAPSAGATYPLEIHAVTRDAVLRYAPEKKAVSELFTGNVMDDLADAALGQPCVRNAAANFVIGGVVSRTAARYGDRAGRYVDIEAGCAGQNLMLMATSLGLGSVMVGAFDDETVRDIALLPKDSIALAIISVGAPK